MDLDPSHDQLAIAEAVRRFCRERIDAARLRAWESDPAGIDEASWQAIAALGWMGLGVPESSGGSGRGLQDVAFLLQECARGLVPRAVVRQIRAAFLLGRIDPDAPELAAAARGEAVLALALEEESARSPECWNTRATGSSSTRAPAITGEKWFVAGADRAHLHIVGAREEDGRPALYLVDPPGNDMRALRAFDEERQFVVRYDGMRARRRLTAGRARIDRVLREQRALALAEMVGGMDAVLDMTVAYVKEREQFGRKIGAFQAVQHQVADMATARTAARHLAWRAICRMEAGTEEGLELEHAAAFVGQWFKRLTLTAHHLHGGAGYVLEHPLHHHSERALALCIRYAPEREALARVAAGLLDAPQG